MWVFESRSTENLQTPPSNHLRVGFHSRTAPALSSIRCKCRSAVTSVTIRVSLTCVNFFRGGQVDVTGSITALLSSTTSPTDDSCSTLPLDMKARMNFSPAVQALLEESGHSSDLESTFGATPTGSPILHRPSQTSVRSARSSPTNRPLFDSKASLDSGNELEVMKDEHHAESAGLASPASVRAAS